EEVFFASGPAVERPDTSQLVISTCPGEPTKWGVTTVAPALVFATYQISVEREPFVARAPAVTYVLLALSVMLEMEVVPLNMTATAIRFPELVAGIVRLEI